MTNEEFNKRAAELQNNVNAMLKEQGPDHYPYRLDQLVDRVCEEILGSEWEYLRVDVIGANYPRIQLTQFKGRL